MLREKREVVILLFLFYRNTGVEGGGKWSFYQKKMHGYIQFFFVVIGACFAPIFAGREYFLFVFHNSISYLIDVELVFNKIYCWRRNNYY